MTSTAKSDLVLIALRANIEAAPVETRTAGEFYDVYLDNASANLGMTIYEFRSCLSVLAQKGLYKVVDSYAWGAVKWEAPTVIVPRGATSVRTLDLTPTWRAIVPVLIAGIENGTPEARKLAIEEIYRMADFCDGKGEKA